MRFRSLAAAVAAAVVSVPLWVPALGSPATAAERREVASVTFVGRGYGHGVGMSQYGARNRANAGQGWQRVRSPFWKLKTTYWWRMTFPAGKPVKVTHQYKPSVGATAGLTFFYDGAFGGSFASASNTASPYG